MASKTRSKYSGADPIIYSGVSNHGIQHILKWEWGEWGASIQIRGKK